MDLLSVISTNTAKNFGACTLKFFAVSVYTRTASDRLCAYIPFFGSSASDTAYILKVESREEAKKICDNEPLVVGGYATYKLIDFLFLPVNVQDCLSVGHEIVTFF